MQTKTLAHLSDLHLGHSDQVRRRAEALCRRVIEEGIDHVVVTGDVTHRGRAAEWVTFLDVFEPLLDTGRVTLVPGNHDRLGDDVASLVMEPGCRVDVVTRPGLHLVRVDSTAPHNRFLVAGHGALCERVIAECEAALALAPPACLRVVLLHHHLLPAPLETLSERLADWVALPFANELQLGRRLLDRIADRTDLVLHGHRHVPCALELSGLPVGVYNAGSSTELGAFRVFRHHAGVREPAHFICLTEGSHENRVALAPLRVVPGPRAVPRPADRARAASA